jgi:hypothetical protein
MKMAHRENLSAIHLCTRYITIHGIAHVALIDSNDSLARSLRLLYQHTVNVGHCLLRDEITREVHHAVYVIFPPGLTINDFIARGVETFAIDPNPFFVRFPSPNRL